MKNPWILAGAVVLFGAAGCQQRETPEQGQPVAQAQRQSEQALERAQEAQEEAREQRGAVAEAREEVTEAQQELTEAQQQVQQERQQALEAQRRAAQQAQAAQQQAQQASEQLTQQQQQAQAGAGAQPDALLTVNGRVAATQEDSLLLRSQAGESVRLLINDDTQVLINGRQGEITDIPEGVEVRASYRSLGEQENTALRVEVMNRATGGSGSEAQQ
jgi:hypothetical protein